MIQLWLGIALLTVLALSFVFIPFIKANRAQKNAETVGRTHKNIEIFEERLAELDVERVAGNLQDHDYNELKLELEKNLLEDASDDEKTVLPMQVGSRQLVAVTLMALLIPVISFGLYFQYGSAQQLQVALEGPEQVQFASGEQPTVEEALQMLVSELEKNPDNAEGWYILATTYMNVGEFEKGVSGFKRVLELLPEDAPQYVGVMGQYAQGLYFAKGGKMDEEVRQQIQRTLDREPLEVTALGLLGIDAFEQSRLEDAIAYWRKALVNAEPAAAESIKSGIQRALEQLATEGKPIPDVPELVNASIQLQVSIAPQLLDKVTPDQTVFVFAKPVGGRMPVAAVRLTVAELPKMITLDDSLAMTPQAKLSLQSEVEIGARISFTGQPQATVGDLQSATVLVSVKDSSEAVMLSIDQIVQ
ncbi:c-type cytochrome biogenesis protein CcmI [Neptunomonas antarctica]|uniref:Cytochrome c-type biogenesis protein CcmH n=1 Tax=Neptunomonas antarctica TaxID=619304 RepID=A0A1N7JD60_9GAMM|nr:c-type cytochrome biogenesis protein CcmI [Neptunomonas antarctica]SIS47181.1 cytochrome c-type biogenesis protein CcmH [Neptunomonas antarctica]